MKFQAIDETVIAEHGSLKLTKYCLIQEVDELGDHTYIEIPIANIDSINLTSHFNFAAVILGILSVLAGILLLALKSQVGYALLIIGMIIIIFALFTRKNIIEFRSKTSTIIEDSKDIKLFVETVRSQMYKK